MSKIKNPSPSDDVMNIINKYKSSISVGHYVVLREHIAMFKQMEEEFKQTVDILRQVTLAFAVEQTEYSNSPKEYMVFGPKYEARTMTEIYPDDESERQTEHDIDEALKLYRKVLKEDGFACIKELKPVDIPKMSLWSKIKLILNI